MGGYVWQCSCTAFRADDEKQMTGFIGLFLNSKFLQTRLIHLTHSCPVSTYLKRECWNALFFKFIYFYLLYFSFSKKKKLVLTVGCNRSVKETKRTTVQILDILGWEWILCDALALFWDSVFCWEQLLVEDSALYCPIDAVTVFWCGNKSLIR